MKRLGIRSSSSSTLVAALVVASSACAPTDPGASFGDGALRPSQGRLVVDLVDAPSTAVKEIWVTIDKVVAHSVSAGWVTVMNDPLTVDLLTLKASAQALGLARLPPGAVTQLRLYTAEAGPQYVVLPDGTEVALKTPSGTQSGIKIHGPWEISACHNTEVTLDFDGHKSLWVHPNGHQDLWTLRPVIHVKRSQLTPAPCEELSDAGEPELDGGIEEGGGGFPGPSLPGSPCDADAQCLSGACDVGVCAPGGPGTPCGDAGDCASGQCLSEGLCAPGTAGGAGGTCAASTQCLSNACDEGTCGPGGQGSLCEGEVDCAEGFSCGDGFCEPRID